MEKYGKAKKRAKDEKMYEEEHFKKWYEEANGQAHKHVNDKLKLKYDLYTFYKHKYGKTKLRKEEKKMDVFFGRSFQSWYKKKLSKKTSAVKKWLNEQKEKRPSNTGSEDDDSSSGVKKGGGTADVEQPPHMNSVFNGTNPFSLHTQHYSEDSFEEYQNNNDAWNEYARVVLNVTTSSSSDEPQQFQEHVSKSISDTLNDLENQLNYGIISINGILGDLNLSDVLEPDLGPYPKGHISDIIYLNGMDTEENKFNTMSFFHLLTSNKSNQLEIKEEPLSGGGNRKNIQNG